MVVVVEVPKVSVDEGPPVVVVVVVVGIVVVVVELVGVSRVHPVYYRWINTHIHRAITIRRVEVLVRSPGYRCTRASTAA